MKGFCINSAIEHLSKNYSHDSVVKKLIVFSSKSSWTPEDRQIILNLITDCLLVSELTEDVAEYFSPILLDLFYRILSNNSKLSLFNTLSKLIGYYSTATSFAYESFNTQIFSSEEILKNVKTNQQFYVPFLEACYTFICYNVQFFKYSFNWNFISDFISHSNGYCRYLSIKIYANILDLENSSIDSLMKDFPLEDLTNFELRCYELTKSRKPKFLHRYIKYATSNSDKNFIYDCDFTSNVVSIYGILLRKLKNVSPHDDSFIILPTIEQNLESLALGISLDKPILVEGNMGSGKSVIIRYLAHLTGRPASPDIITVQISDQVDTKYLLGSYICSDIPGEFVFNLGPLLKAIRDGSWIIFEDIDFASSDIISLIYSIIETKSVSCIPGCENKIDRYNTNFRIFFTRRLYNNSSEVNSFALVKMLEKLCYKVTIPNLNNTELEQLILTKWPILSPIVSRILNIFENLNNSEFNIKSKRHITLRDLVKWCKRLSSYFQINSNEVPKHAFLDAIDCFVDFYSSEQFIADQSLIFGSNFNLSKSECEYLLTTRTPDCSISDSMISIGRQTIKRNKVFKNNTNFAFTTQSLKMLEKLFVCVNNKEPVLLCGETGVGKTSCIQYLANLYGKKLIVINMNQQSDSVELFGGYKPIDFKFLINNVKDEYQELFTSSFDVDKNNTFLTKFVQIYMKQDWHTLVQIMLHVCDKALVKFLKDAETKEKWIKLIAKLDQIQKHLKSKNELTFAFIEGALTQAVKTGQWVLLDEINLAEYETLQSLLSLLENDGSFLLFEKSNDQNVAIHEEFRLFACMNPATDIGKRELPIGIQNRFTEFYIKEVSDKSQLRVIVHTYIGNMVSASIVEAIVEFYIQVKHDASNLLKDINGYRPTYSLRNLCRALRVANANPFASINRSIYEAFCLAFLSNLDAESYSHIQVQIEKIIFKNIKLSNLLKAKIEMPNVNDYVMIENYPIVKGQNDIFIDETYILTDTVRKNLKDICRIISAGRVYPILLQGETSVGKTSLIHWLAKATGNTCYRVNNHEHTDLQEYVGSYTSDTNGKIFFKEGILVEAMRNGHWLILDELNLAPTEVLEALNRVLDDNRELFIPETQEVIKAHPRFLLFATQNPPGRYGGRKVLSRAFRNRFIELNFSEIPPEELEIILHRKCTIPLSYSKRMVSVLLELQKCRSKSDIFAGKHGLITLRDLFRWGYRYFKFARDLDSNIKFFDWNEFLAVQGYLLLAGRVRKNEETCLIKDILEKKFRCKILLDDIFYSDKDYHKSSNLANFKNIVWTKAFKRLGSLLYQAILFEEPVLLVGETGCGKTTICQYFAALKQTDLKIINCHMNTESADFLGSLRPNRNLTDNSNDALFEWVDGPLIKAMKEGQFLLVDEISLADDSVLERLNSVLELEKTIFLAENSETSLIHAKESFRYFATMNPGGDYGKKELSPALRDRFTEIWCPVFDDISDIKLIITNSLQVIDDQTKINLCDIICDFISWFDNFIFNSKHFTYSVRDILSWVNFINETYSIQRCLNLRDAFINGAFLVFIDSLGACNMHTSKFNNDLTSLRKTCKSYIEKLSLLLTEEPKSLVPIKNNSLRYFSVDEFSIEKGNHFQGETEKYYWKSSGVKVNLYRIMRALQLDKPILLEGPPGVGKTSLIQALATATGHSLIRINLSDQTDITDLFGCDLPMEGENSAGKFVFRDGPLLTALKSDSTWILLDELNLASQTVLEGLNACLDHRGEIYIPELNKTFNVNKTKNRIFASQNPFSMDGTRKGLPKSFLNRFTMVYIDNLKDEDFYFILSTLYSSIDSCLISKMISVNHLICEKVIKDPTFAKQGGPFEFNLRDLLRWAEVTLESAQLVGRVAPELFFDLIYVNKMRTNEDKHSLKSICNNEFQYDKKLKDLSYFLTDSLVQFGYSVLKRKVFGKNELNESFIFELHKEPLESLIKCVEMNWMAILIGNSGCGKTFLVKLLSNLCGRNLNILSVNSEMDNTDLLGGFEQKDLANDLKELEQDIVQLCQLLLKSKFQCVEIAAKFLSYMSKLKNMASDFQNINQMFTYKLSIFIEMLNLFNGDSDAQKLIEKVKLFQKINKQSLNGSFEWKDSQLIKSIQNGDWLLIDNGNFLNPSVLDRLNSLLETNGYLIINEKGSVDGEMTCIKPHPDFRLFITMDPQYGELSRAMRNRGIEIVISDLADSHELNQLLTQYSFQLNNDCSANICANYSLFFKFIFETIRQNQHGFESQHLTTVHSLKQALLPKSINDQMNNYFTFYPIQDFQVLNIHDLTSTKLRIFLDNSSFKDILLRTKLLNSLPYPLQEAHATQFEQSKAFIDNLKAHCPFTSFENLPIDHRENNFLWNYMKNVDSKTDGFNIWNNLLNKMHLNLFWFDLKQRLYQKPFSEHSLISVAEKSNQNFERKTLEFIIPIYKVIQSLQSDLIDQFLQIIPKDEDFVTYRSHLIWCYQLIKCCLQNTEANLDKFITENFFPIWYKWNEKMVKPFSKLVNFAKFDTLMKEVHAIFNLNFYVFDKQKYNLVKSLTHNYFNFKSSQQIEIFSIMNEFCKLMKKQCSQQANIKKFNELSSQSVQTFINYLNSQVEFEDAREQFSFYSESIKAFNAGDSSVDKYFNTENVLVKSNLFLKSILSSKILNIFMHGYSEIDNVVTLYMKKSIFMDPMLLFISNVSRHSNVYTDLFPNFMMNLNEDLNIDSVIESLGSKSSHASEQNSYLPCLNINSSSQLTTELMPLLSLTCFNIYQIEHITMEQFFSKNHSQKFYMKFLVDNYEILKTRDHILFNNIIQFAQTWHSCLAKQSKEIGSQIEYQLKSLQINPEQSQLSEDFDKCLYLILVGYFLSSSTLVDYSIDPIVRQQAKLSNRILETQVIEEELTLRRELYQQKYGYSRTDFQCSVFTDLQGKLQSNKVKISNETNATQTRLIPSKYFDLKSDLNQFCNAIFNFKNILNICTDLKKCFEKRNLSQVKKLITKCLNFQNSLSQFINHVCKTYINYNDLTSVFLNGATIVLKGLQLIVYRLQSMLNTHNWFEMFDSQSFAQLFDVFFKFTNTYCPHEIGEFIFDNSCVSKFLNVASKLNIEEKYLITSILKSSFIEIENSILLGFDKDYLFTLYLNIVDMFVQWWKKIKETEELEKIKEEALFHLKLEDEPEDDQLKLIFPSFEDKYRDLIEEDMPRLDSKPLVDESSIEFNISKETLLFIIKSHMSLLEQMQLPESVEYVDFVKPYLIRYQILSDISKKTLGFIDMPFEKHLIDGHVLVNQYLLNISNKEQDGEDKPINVYRESLVSQTQKCYNVLESLKTKIISELLPQFENHPTLLKLLKIIERINRLEVNSSLLSFATGLELILKISEDWELIAHRGISLNAHLIEITELLVSWRKLEITYWAECLESISLKINEKELVTWWFHLYTTLEEVIKSDSQELAISLADSVKKYFERSTLGQFHIRLLIVKSFIHQLQTCSYRKKQICIYIRTAFENLYYFYNYFSNNVKKAIQNEQSPIEKEIKEFVKISKWNPKNFWSLKASLDKSHRQLYGYLKKFENSLSKPANMVFDFDKSLTSDKWIMCSKIQSYVTSTSNSIVPPLVGVEKYKYVCEISQFTTKSNRLCMKIFKNTKSLVKEINLLEEVNIMLIDGLNEYSNMKVTQTADLEKWKKSVAQIQNKKRRALSDLFKHLTRLGLSFRKGNVHFSKLDLNEIIFTIKSLSSQTTFENESLNNIESCNTYFYKILSGYMKFALGIENPNSQLTMDMIERIRGFTVELARLTIRRRKFVSDTLSDFHTLNKYCSQLKEKSNNFSNNDCFIVDFTKMEDYFKKTKMLSIKLVSFIIRLKTVGHCLQTNYTSEKILLIEKQDSDFTTIDKLQLDNIIGQIKEASAELPTNSLLYTTTDLNKLKLICGQLSKCISNLNDVLELCPCLINVNRESLSYFNEEISLLTKDLHELEKCYQASPSESIVAPEDNNSILLCNLLIKNVLISIEKVYRHINSSKEMTENIDQENFDQNLIPKMALSKLLTSFNIKKIIGLFKKFVDSINQSNTNLAMFNCQLIYSLDHLLSIYSHLLKNVLSISFGCLKTTNKLLHIILTLFNELIANGFCLPPEPNNDQNANSQLKDMQNSGFGQGDTSGAQDVSERLDCQDQLDEMVKSGEEQTEDDESPNGEKNNENGIEMDEDFDGNEYGDEKDVDNEENNDQEEESENEDNFDDKMGNVDEDADALDENLWGDESEDSDIEDLNDDTTGGKDNIESEIVANEDNKDLDKDKDAENKSNEDEDDSNSNEESTEINENEMNDEYLNENPDVYKENDKNNLEQNTDKDMELPEDMQLDDDGDDDGEDADSEQLDENSNKDDSKENDDISDNEMEDNVDDLNQEQTETAMDIEDEQDNTMEEDVEKNEENNTELDSNNVDKPFEEVNNEDENEKVNSTYSDMKPGNSEMQENSTCLAEQDQNDGDNDQKDNAAQNSQTQKDKISQRFNEEPNTSKEQASSEDPSLSKNRKNQRSMAENTSNAKRQRLMNSEKEESSQQDKESKPSDAYRHVDNVDKANDVAYDIANPDELEEQKIDDFERGVEINEEKEIHNDDVEEMLNCSNTVRKSNNDNENQDTNNANDMETIDHEGDLVATMSVMRDSESSYYSSNNLQFSKSLGELEMSVPLDDTIMHDESMAESLKQYEKKIDPLVYELCNQLQLVLEPTKCSKFKGDYKSGKRLNMRKVIAYVASDFRKDKIWLRRSKPSKRQYQIIIGVDDSLSMSDNRSKQMAFESLILLGKSLSIIESGALSVLSFGEEVKVVHSFNEHFSDQSAIRMFSKFQFSQQKTKISELLKCSLSLFSNSRQSINRKSNSSIYQLLLIVSDGRGIYSEGEEAVQRAVMRLKEMGIFVVFIVIDNPEHKNSILDIRVPVFDESGKIKIESYIEKFPFPYYVILKDINSLPSILGEALRQWFELISHETK